MKKAILSYLGKPRVIQYLRISLAAILFFGSVNIDAAATVDTTTAGINGGGSQYAPCSEILRFDNYNDAVASTPAGQDFIFTLANGDFLSLTLKKTGGAIVAVPTPSWSGSAFGVYGYTGAAGNVVLYIQNTGQGATLLFDNIILRDKNGNIVPDYTMLAFDGEATGIGESIDVSTAAGYAFYDWDSITPPGGPSVPLETGIGTNSVSWTGNPPYAPLYLARSVAVHAPPFLSVNLNETTTGFEGVVLGIKRIIVAPDISTCSNGNTTFHLLNAPDGTTYTWPLPIINPPGSVTGATAQLFGADSISQTLVRNNAGVDTVTYTVTPTSCGLPGTPFLARIIIGNGPSLSITPHDTSLCAGGSTTLTVVPTDTGGTFNWAPTGGNAATATVSPATTTTYTVTYSLSGCTSVDSAKVFIGLPPDNLGNDTTYCGFFGRVLSTGLSATIWSTGDTAAQIFVNSPGLYIAQMTNTCATVADTILIYDKPAPIVNLGSDTFLCYSDTLLLNATNANSFYQWQNSSNKPTYLVTTSGTYSVTVTDTSGCAVMDTIQVSYAWESPQPDLGGELQICGDSTLLHAGIPNAHYLWSDNSTDSVYHVYKTGVYSVTVTDGCGTGTASVNVSIHTDECALLLPTGFSPNGDGNNDVFRAISHCQAKNFSMIIYSRWGEQVFQTNDITQGWDGTFHNKNQPMSVYVYYIEYFNYCENKIKKIGGNVTLVR